MSYKVITLETDARGNVIYPWVKENLRVLSRIDKICDSVEHLAPADGRHSRAISEIRQIIKEVKWV